ncbi:hypothetical protein HXY33_05675 [Candidatus Bathyarchaeota archaeon]|nr:hypothetical protein [Candidatus Bathyarchaeota archaeon]
MKNRKSLDFLALLLISMLIVSASAAIYYAMLAQSSATIGAAAVYFTTGKDSSGILSLGTNNTFASLSLSAYPNVTLYYDEAVNITATAAKQIRLRHVSISPGDGNPNVSNFTSIVFRLIAANGTELGNLTYTTATDDWTEPTQIGYFAIGAGQEWAIKVETKATAGATTGISTTIVIAVDVT